MVYDLVDDIRRHRGKSLELTGDLVALIALRGVAKPRLQLRSLS